MVPQTTAQGEIIKEEKENPSRTTSAGRILVVEDEEDLAVLLEYNLKKANYQVYSTDNGRKALQLVEKILPDVILLDILLPEVTGWEVCRTIRRHPKEEVASIPIIMLTALRDDEDKYRGLDLGADVFLKKPYALQEVLLHCRNLTANRKRHLGLIREKEQSLQGQKEDIYKILFHELKNQLTIIGGMTDFLGRDVRNAKKLKYVQAIQKSTEYLETIVKELSVLEQIYQNDNKLPQEMVSLHKILREVIALLAPLAYKKNISIQLASPSMSFQFRQCRTAIKIILVLILENALKYSPWDSSVKIDLTRSQDIFRVAITDNGPGIDLEEQLKIFEKSYRTRQAREKYSGTGLGLYIAKKIGDSINCAISLKSRPGEGCTFICTFPFANE